MQPVEPPSSFCEHYSCIRQQEKGRAGRGGWKWRGQNRNEPRASLPRPLAHALWRSERVGISDARQPSGLIGSHRERPKRDHDGRASCSPVLRRIVTRSLVCKFLVDKRFLLPLSIDFSLSLPHSLNHCSALKEDPTDWRLSMTRAGFQDRRCR